jgi:signal peptidase II
MAKIWRTLLLIALMTLVIDQIVKYGIMIEGWRFSGDYFSIILTYNKGVAFSMFAFLGPYLKYIQLILIGLIIFYLSRHKQFLKAHYLPMGLLIGAGCSNILDRFWHGGVVDYIFWHRWFEFAVFNLADVMINIAVVILLWQTFMHKPSKAP